MTLQSPPVYVTASRSASRPQGPQRSLLKITRFHKGGSCGAFAERLGLLLFKRSLFVQEFLFKDYLFRMTMRSLLDSDNSVIPPMTGWSPLG